jgi:LAGLIDADG endonuclease
MLEHPSIRRYSFIVIPHWDDVAMSSENPTGADDQQETATPRLELDAGWVVGFVDGEGCFSVSIHHNPRFAKRTGGWQIHPVFHVYQHEVHRAVLEGLVTFFGCGRIRGKGPGSNVLTYAVDGLYDLERYILPFFESHPPVVKLRDFLAFAAIVRLLREKRHFTPSGFEQAVRLAYGMNLAGKQRARSLSDVLAGSSETVRQAPPAQR